MTTKKASTSKKTSAKTSTSKKTSARKKIGDQAIRDRAQEIYLKRMEEGTPGDADSDWLQAEQELMNQ